MQALGLLREMAPAVLILDMVMPGMSGHDVCHIVKSGQRLEMVPVVFLTARGTPKDRRTRHDSGGVI